MKFRTLLIPTIALGMSVVGCTKPVAKPNWSKDLQNEMRELFGFVLPYFETKKDAVIKFDENNRFFIHFEESDFEALKGLAGRVAGLLEKADFEGTYDEDTYTGYYTIDAEAREKYNLTFDRQVVVSYYLADYSSTPYDSDFYFSAYNLYESKQIQEFPAAIVTEVTGEENPKKLESETYWLTVYDYDEVDVSFVGKDGDDLDYFVESIEAEYWYTEYDADNDNLGLALPWEENYAISAWVISSEIPELVFGYSSYEYPADIYESFPQEAVVEYYEYQAEFYYETELPDDFSVPALPAERVKGETGYKVWESAYGGLCIDVIDLNPSNADLRLDKLYPEILLAAGYTYDEEYECYIYVVEEGVWEIDVYINETDGGYFTAKFSDWYN